MLQTDLPNKIPKQQNVCSTTTYSLLLKIPFQSLQVGSLVEKSYRLQQLSKVNPRFLHTVSCVKAEVCVIRTPLLIKEQLRELTFYLIREESFTCSKNMTKSQPKNTVENIIGETEAKN